MRAVLGSLAAVLFIAPATFADGPPAQSPAEARKVIDSFRGKPAAELSVADLQKLIAAREALRAYGTRLLAARAVLERIKGAKAEDLTPELLKEVAEAKRLLQEEPAAAPARDGDARHMLGLWDLRFETRRGRRTPGRMTLVVLDACLVTINAAGEIEGVGPYQLGRAGSRSVEIDFTEPINSIGRYQFLGLLEARESSMRIAFVRPARPGAPPVPRPEKFVQFPGEDEIVWEFERRTEARLRAGPKAERYATKSVGYEDLRRALADVERINGRWETADGKLRLTFDNGTIKTAAGASGGYRLFPLTQPKTMTVPPRLLGVSRPGAGTTMTVDYELDGDQLVLQLPEAPAKPAGPNFDDTPFGRPAGRPPAKDDRPTPADRITLRRVVEKP